MISPQEYETLLTRIARGKKTALLRLADQITPRLYALCLRITGDTAAAEDVLETVLIRLWQDAGQLGAQRTARFDQMLALCRDLSVARLRSADHGPRDAQTVLSEGTGPVVGPSAFATALTQVAPIHVAVLRGAYLDGVTYADAADALGHTQITIQNALRRSLRAVRDGADGGDVSDTSLLAAEYVLGLGTKAQDAAVSEQIQTDPDLAREVETWRADFTVFSQELVAVTPPPQVLQRVETRVFGGPPQRVWPHLVPYLVGAVAACLLAWVVLQSGILNTGAPPL